MKRLRKSRSRSSGSIQPTFALPSAAFPAPPASAPQPSLVYRVDRWRSSQPPNPAMLRNHLAREGYSVYQWSDPAGTVYGMHRHETAQSHWIVSGILEICVEARGTFTLEAGDRDFMPANTYHSARVVGDEPVLYLIGEMPRRSA